MLVLALPYLPEDLNHFQEFTTFLDSIGLPAEWLPTEGEAAQLNEVAIEDPQKPPPSSQEHSRPRRGLREESRGDSPFRSWLPSVPRGDQSLGTLSDSGMFSLDSLLTFRAGADLLKNHHRAPSHLDSMFPRTNAFGSLHHSKTFVMSSQTSLSHLAIL